MELKSKWVVMILAVQVVGGMLHGGRTGRFPYSLGTTTMPAGVLAGGALYAHAALHQAVLLRVAALDAPLLQVLAHIADRRSCPPGVPMVPARNTCPVAEKLHHLVVGLGLVFSGEVQVDVGHLVPGKAQEYLKGDVEAVLHQGASAQGAILVRQVHAHLVLALVHVEKALYDSGGSGNGAAGRSPR